MRVFLFAILLQFENIELGPFGYSFGYSAAGYVALLKSCSAAASFRSLPNPRWPSFFSMPFPSLFGLHRRQPARDGFGRLRL